MRRLVLQLALTIALTTHAFAEGEHQYVQHVFGALQCSHVVLATTPGVVSIRPARGASDAIAIPPPTSFNNRPPARAMMDACDSVLRRENTP